MAKRSVKADDLYHFTIMHDDGTLVCACDDVARASDKMLGNPNDPDVLKHAEKLDNDGKVCPMCRKLYAAYSTGFRSGFEHGCKVSIMEFDKMMGMLGHEQEPEREDAKQNAPTSKTNH